VSLADEFMQLIFHVPIYLLAVSVVAVVLDEQICVDQIGGFDYAPLLWGAPGVRLAIIVSLNTKAFFGRRWYIAGHDFIKIMIQRIFHNIGVVHIGLDCNVSGDHADVKRVFCQ
jgi:hypothetical protein